MQGCGGDLPGRKEIGGKMNGILVKINKEEEKREEREEKGDNPAVVHHSKGDSDAQGHK